MSRIKSHFHLPSPKTRMSMVLCDSSSIRSGYSRFLNFIRWNDVQSRSRIHCKRHRTRLVVTPY